MPATSADQRRYPRLTLSPQQARGVQTYCTHPEAEPIEPAPSMTVVDLSVGGAGIVFAERLPIGARCELQVRLPGSTETIAATGHVIWAASVARPIAGRPGSWYRHGVRFRPGSEEAAADLLGVLRGQGSDQG